MKYGEGGRVEHEGFTAASGCSFALGDGETLTLHEVSDMTRGLGVASYSLLFRGAVELQQGIVSLHNDEHGSCEIFLVPVGIEGDQHEYEAVFTSVEQGVVT